MNSKNYKQIPPWFGCCLVMTVTVFFMNETIAARKTKTKSQQRISAHVLLLKIKERDVIIADLMSRIEMLEHTVGGAANGGQKNFARNSLLPPPSSEQSSVQAEKSNKQTQTKTAEAEAPGEFKVDLQASQRALERTLAKSGALLLPTWFLDTDLNFNFTHQENPTFINIIDPQTRIASLVAGKSRQNTFEPSIGFRLGLPHDAQLEISLPYRFVNQSINAPLLPGFETHANGSGLGDLQIGLAKTVLKEKAWWPDLIARVSWNADIGERNDNGVNLGGGIQSITGSLTALKRQDPLAFFLNASYTKTFTTKNYFIDGNGVPESFNAGDTIGVSFGTQLAASANTSLSLALNQLFVSNTTRGSQTIAGSNRNIGILTIGASSIISRNVFVNINAGMGLTEDSPDYTAGISISTRTNLKPYLGVE